MRNYLAHFHFIGKLLFLILPPLAIIFYFTTDKIVREYTAYEKLEEVQQSLLLSIQIGAVVHELQIERGMSAGYIGSTGAQFADKLPHQRELVEIQFAALKTLMGQYKTGNYFHNITHPDSVMSDIAKVRQEIDAHSIPLEKEIDVYTRIISSYLDGISSIANDSDDVWLVRELSAFTSLLYAKERMGVERALGSNTFAKGTITTPMRNRIAMLIAEQNTFLKFFLERTNPGVQSYYREAIRRHSFTELENAEQILLETDQSAPFTIEPEHWFMLCTQKIDLYKRVHEYLTSGLVARIDQRRSEKFDSVLYTLILDLILLAGGIAMLFTVSRRLYVEIRDQQNVLIQQSKMAAMGEMIGAISHQWRQPLNGVGVLIQEIEMKYRLGELDAAEMESLTDEILRYLEYMSHTIDDFRNFFKPTKKKTVFDLHKAITESLDITEKQLKEHGINVEIVEKCDTSIQTCRYTTEGFESEFKQVIINLINNAREAIEERARHTPALPNTITITLDRSGTDVIIRVRDTGGGIPESVLPNIFDLYVSTKHAQQGTGLGLYMSKLIIERNMLGHMGARNIEGGAEFEIILEAADESSQG